MSALKLLSAFLLLLPGELSFLHLSAAQLYNQQYTVWVNIIHFYFMTKTIRY